MSWDYCTVYEQAVCACGNGVVTREKHCKSGDWGRSEEHIHNEEIKCENCAANYHIEHRNGHHFLPWKGDWWDIAYLVPNGCSITLPTKPQYLPFEQTRAFEERAIASFTKEELADAVVDMKTHKYSTRLTLESSRELVGIYKRAHNSVKLSNIISAIESCIVKYDTYEWTCDKVKRFREEETVILDNNKKQNDKTLSESFELKFETVHVDVE